MLDFDFTHTRLVDRVARDFFTCELPCTSPTRVPGTANHKNRFTITPDRLYFAARVPPSTIDDVYSVAFDGSKLENRTRFAPAGGPTGAHVEALALDGGLTRIEQLVSLVRERELGYRTLLEVPTGMTGNPERVGHTTHYVHENHGAILRYFPKQVRLQVTENNPDLEPTPAEMTLTGGSMVPPASDPTPIATTPRGPTITTKNPKKFEKYHKNFEIVRKKIIEVEERDHVRNFQPPISGEEIMALFNLKPSREIGILKEAVKEAIWEGEITNDYESALKFVLNKAEKIGLKSINY